MYYPAENMASKGARFEAYVRLYEAKIESIGKNRGNWEVMEIFGNENTGHTPSCRTRKARDFAALPEKTGIVDLP